MANGKCAVIGDRDSILLFKAVGIEDYDVTDGEQANRTLHRLARLGYAVVYVTETYYPACEETIREFQGEPYPAIIPIPDARGGEKNGGENVSRETFETPLFLLLFCGIVL